MSEPPVQPDDPAFLASRALDGDVSAEEQRQLDEALAASEQLRIEAEQLRKVDRLVKRWAGAGVELDWASYAKLIHARVEAEVDEGELERVGRLVEHWGSAPVEFDEAAFTDGVMARIRSEERRSPKRNLIFRIGAPLAAAAAVAIAVSGWFWARAPRDTGPPDAPPSVRLVVRYDRTPVESDREETKTPSISLLALGASPMREPSAEAPPL